MNVLAESNFVLEIALRKRAFDEASRRILAVAEIVPLTGNQLEAARSRHDLALGPQDAIIFSAVTEFLSRHAGESSVFINRNAVDFLEKSVAGELAGLGCKLIVKFSDARSYIERGIGRAAEGR